MNPELYEKHYKFEWNHRAYLSSSSNIPIGVMSVIGGALTVIIQKFPYNSSVETTLFIFCVSLSIASLLAAVIYLFLATIGYQYERIATPKKLENYYNELLQWWEENGGGEKEAQEDHANFVLSKLAEATEINALNNKKKSLYLYKTNFLLAVSFVFLAISSVPYLVKTAHNEQTVYRVELVNPQTFDVEDKRDDTQKTTTTNESEAKTGAPKTKTGGTSK